jgi:hypothetical protein
MKLRASRGLIGAFAFAPLLALPAVAQAKIVANPLCPDNTAFFNPTLPPNIVLPDGFTASFFAAALEAPTGTAFLGDASSFRVFVLESGHGLPSRCNDQSAFGRVHPSRSQDLLRMKERIRRTPASTSSPTPLSQGRFSRAQSCTVSKGISGSRRRIPMIPPAKSAMR